MATKINEVLSTEVGTKWRNHIVTRRYFFIGYKRNFLRRLGKFETHPCNGMQAWARVFNRARDDSVWISAKADRAETLLAAASASLAWSHGRQRQLGDLLLLQPPKVESIPALHSVFRHVIGAVNTFRLLPAEELVDVLLSPPEEAQDLFIGGSVDSMSQTVTLTRGNLQTVVAPLAMFIPSGKAAPDHNQFSVGDYGHTVRFGDYEAATDAILYEIDPTFRRRQNAKRRAEERGFGPSLRRLRIQKRLARTDFPGVTSKTIARIERGEIKKPHGKTLRVLATSLGVKPDEIESY